MALLSVRIQGLTRESLVLRAVTLHALLPEVQDGEDDSRWLDEARYTVAARFPPLPPDAHCAALRLLVKAAGERPIDYNTAPPADILLDVQRARAVEKALDPFTVVPAAYNPVEQPPGTDDYPSVAVSVLEPVDGAHVDGTQAVHFAFAVSPDDGRWHELCVHVIRLDSLETEPLVGELAGDAVGCLGKAATSGSAGGLPEGSLRLQVYATDEAGEAISRVSAVDITVGSRDLGSSDDTGQPTADVDDVEVEVLPIASAHLDLDAARSMRHPLGMVETGLPQAPESSFSPSVSLSDSGQAGACPSRWLVALLALPEEQNANLQVFEHIHIAVADGLRELGRDVEEFVCPDLRLCHEELLSRAEGRQTVIIGSNVLHLYLDSEGGPAVLQHRLVPDDSILYNFEYITRRDQMGHFENSWVTDAFVAVHKRYTVWEYSFPNVAKWSDEYGIDATLVPIGFVPRLELPEAAPVQEEDKSIDVLFDGTPNPHRVDLLQSVVNDGVNITWEGGFGAEAHQRMAHAKILLSINAFGGDDEFKIARTMRYLANGGFVLSEKGGAVEDIGPLEGGIVFAERHELASTINFYLTHPGLRHQVAEQGRRLFQARRQGDLLRQVVAEVEQHRRDCA